MTCSPMCSEHTSSAHFCFQIRGQQGTDTSRLPCKTYCFSSSSLVDAESNESSIQGPAGFSSVCGITDNLQRV